MSSYILRCQDGFRWDGAPDEAYKAEGEKYFDVRRVPLAGMRGESTNFHVRYFEIGPGGFTTREKHRHEHVIVVLRGEGDLLIGDQWHHLQFGDVAYVQANAVHQLRNDLSEPFGFVCVVDAQRDRPIPVDDPSLGCGCEG